MDGAFRPVTALALALLLVTQCFPCSSAAADEMECAILQADKNFRIKTRKELQQDLETADRNRRRASGRKYDFEDEKAEFTAEKNKVEALIATYQQLPQSAQDQSKLDAWDTKLGILNDRIYWLNIWIGQMDTEYHMWYDLKQIIESDIDWHDDEISNIVALMNALNC